MDAQHNPVKRKYTQREVVTSEMEIGQKPDIDLNAFADFIRSESLADNVGEKSLTPEYAAALAFNEEPVTIRIEENTGNSDFPETHVPCYINGTPAEVFDSSNNRWMPFGYVPIGVEMIMKRKYVENLMRSKPDSIRTSHQDATVERPQNTIRRSTRAQYPVTVIYDANPKGPEWQTRVMRGH